jgi:hypothetical protein
MRAASDMRRPLFVWRDLDETCAKHSVYDLGDLEFRQDETFRDLVQISLAIDHGEHFPFSRQEIDE